jgi:hypothetical protein
MFKRKGQSTLEYALITAVVVGGLLLMQHYVKRGFAGRLKSASDDMGEQFDPHVYKGEFTVTQSSETHQTVKNRETRTQHLKDQISKKTGKEDIAAWEEDEDLYSK